MMQRIKPLYLGNRKIPGNEVLISYISVNLFSFEVDGLRHEFISLSGRLLTD